MRRRDKTGGNTAKTQRRKTLKRRNAPKVARRGSSLDASDETNLVRLTRELDEALQQQIATSEVLSIIRRSPADAQPVFDAIVQSAARLCGAIFSVVYLCDGDRLRIAATNNLTPAATNQLRQRQELKRPDRSNIGGRAILDRAIALPTVRAPTGMPSRSRGTASTARHPPASANSREYSGSASTSCTCTIARSNMARPPMCERSGRFSS